MSFRKDLLWGFATAAAQIEGGGAASEIASGRGPSIWDKFCETPGKINDGSHVNRTCAHIDNYKADVALLANLGVNSYRFSISWPRVIPKGGRDDPVNDKGLQFYDDLIDELIKHNITPFVTLYQYVEYEPADSSWDLPLGLWDRYGGWLNQGEVVQDFTHYAKLCFDRYGDRVRHWLTFNEPWCVAAHGHYHGQFAPGHKSNTEPWIVGHSLIIAHATAAKLYINRYKPKQRGQIGITLNGDWTEPFDESPKTAQDKMDAAVGWFADPIYLGHYPPSLKEMLGNRLPDFTPHELELLKDSSDFFGANSYTTNIIKAGGTDESAGNTQLSFVTKTGETIGWECEQCWNAADIAEMDWHRAVPFGIRKFITYLWKRYQKPIYITENGYPVPGESHGTKDAALHDTLRIKFYQEYLANIRDAVSEDGVDLRAYFAWSFLDNFEWNSGLVPRFGCVYTDYATFERTPKDSAYWLGKVSPE